MAQILLTDVGFTHHRLLFCESALAPEPVENRQRHLDRDLPGRDRVRHAHATQPIVRLEIESGQTLRGDRGGSRASRSAARDLGGEIRPPRDGLRHCRVTIGRHVGGTQLRRQGVGQRDRRGRIEAERTREIDPGASELVCGDDELAGCLRQLRPGPRDVDRRADARLLLRHREPDELRSERRVRAARRDQGLRPHGAPVRECHILGAGFYDRRALRGCGTDLPFGRADPPEIREIENRLREPGASVIGAERPDSRRDHQGPRK